MNLTLGTPFEDGTCILYVNGEYRGNSDLDRLMHDFNCNNADDMYFDLLNEKTRYLKEKMKKPPAVIILSIVTAGGFVLSIMT